MPKLIVNEIITAKEEVTYNVDPTPVAADAVLVEDLQVDFRGARMISRTGTRTSLGQLKKVFGGSLLGLRFNVEIKGSGVAGTPPEIAPLLKACRMAETTVASTSVTYKPSSGSTQKSCAIYLYEDGLRYVVTGCRGTVSGNLATGGVGKLSFDMVGHFTGPTDTPLIAPAYDSTVPPAIIGAPFVVDGYAAVIAALNFDLGNRMALLPSMSSADGYGEVTITGRDVRGSFDPESVSVATKDFVGQWKSRAAVVIDTGVIGSTAGNRYRVQFPAASYREISRAEREGARALDIGFDAAESTTDDETSLIFT